MGAKLGFEAKAYRNAGGTYEAPNWQEIDLVKDVTLNLERGKADATSRASGGWKQYLPALKDASVEFEIIWDTADAAFQALHAAWLAGSAVDLAILDGDVEVSGSQGLRAEFAVFDFTRNEPLDGDAITAKVTLAPRYSEHAPEWMTV